jgi:hypothetical protein
MSDTEEWERSVQQVLLPSEDSDNRTLVEMPPKRKLTVSHINKKLEDYHGEIRTEQQTLVEWVLQKEKQEQERERQAAEERHEKEVRRREKEQREQRKEQQESEERVRRERAEADERERKRQRQAAKDRAADEQAAQNNGNWRDLKQWQAKESGRIDGCLQDINQLKGSVEDVKRDIVKQEKGLREIDSNHRRANEELHRVIQKQAQFQDRTDERVDVCEKSVEELRHRLHRIALKVEETPRPTIDRHVGFRPIEREISPVRDLNDESPIVCSPRAIRGQPEFCRLAPPWDRRIRVEAPLQNEPAVATIQLPNFAGDSDLIVFQRQCQVIAVHNRWSDEQLCMQILTHLKGKAADLLTYFADITTVRLEELWEALFSRFGKHTSADAARQDLHNLRQKKEQSFASLGLDVEKLVRFAFPRANDETLEELMLDHFIKAIAHQHVRYQTRLVGPRDMAAAIEEADRIHRIMCSEGTSRHLVLARCMTPEPREANPVAPVQPPQQPRVEARNPRKRKNTASGGCHLPPQGQSTPKFCRDVPQPQDARWNQRSNPCVRFEMGNDRVYREASPPRPRESRREQRDDYNRRSSWRSQSQESRERNNSPFESYRSRSSSRECLKGRGTTYY